MATNEVVGPGNAEDGGGTATVSPPDVERRYEVFVAYNGVEKPFKVTASEPVQVLLNAAIHEFHVTAQPHLLALFTATGVELPDAAKLGDVGVKSHDHLLMRPGAVKGG